MALERVGGYWKAPILSHWRCSPLRVGRSGHRGGSTTQERQGFWASRRAELVVRVASGNGGRFLLFIRLFSGSPSRSQSGQPCASFSTRSQDQVQNRRDRRRRRVAEVGKAACARPQGFPRPSGPRQARGHFCLHAPARRVNSTSKLAKTEYKCRSLRCFVSAFILGDVNVAELPAHRIGLRKVLGLLMDSFNLHSPHFRVGRVQYRELVLVTIVSVPLPLVQLLWMMLYPFSGGSHA